MNDADNETFLSDSDAYALEDAEFLCSGPLPEDSDEEPAGSCRDWRTA